MNGSIADSKQLLVLFVDTNLFLHCRDVRQLPFGDLHDGPIMLVVTRPVASEINQKKAARNARVAKRARRAAKYFRKVASREWTPPPAMQILTASGARAAAAIGMTDPDADEQIVAIAVEYVDAEPDCQVAILTSDAGLHALANAHEITCIEPPDSWIETEVDQTLVELQEARKSLKEIKSRRPKLQPSIQVSDGWLKFDPDANIVLGIPDRHVPFERDIEKQAADLKASVRARSSHPFLGDFTGPEPEKVAEFRTEVDQWKTNLAAWRIEYSHCLNLTFGLTNDGNTTAAGIQVEVRAVGGATFIEVEDFPAKPEKPRKPRSMLDMVVHTERFPHISPGPLASSSPAFRIFDGGSRAIFEVERLGQDLKLDLPPIGLRIDEGIEVVKVILRLRDSTGLCNVDAPLTINVDRTDQLDADDSED